MEDLELIAQLKTLKEIKPRKEWASLLKTNLLEKQEVLVAPVQRVSFMNVFSFVFTSKRLAYSFAVILFVVIGVFGFIQLTPVDEQSVLKQNVVALSSGVDDLVKQGRNETTINEINVRASELAKNISEKMPNPIVMKEVARSFKTLADVTGVDLDTNPDVVNLYQIVVENQIADLEKSTLSESQQKTLDEVKDLYSQEKYAEALEKILLVN